MDHVRFNAILNLLLPSGLNCPQTHSSFGSASTLGNFSPAPTKFSGNLSSITPFTLKVIPSSPMSDGVYLEIPLKIKGAILPLSVRNPGSWVAALQLIFAIDCDSIANALSKNHGAGMLLVSDDL